MVKSIIGRRDKSAEKIKVCYPHVYTHYVTARALYESTVNSYFVRK